MIEAIQEIFQQKYRRYLSVFRLAQDASLTNTIFRAVFNSKKNKQTCLNLSTWKIIFSPRRTYGAAEVARISGRMELCGRSTWYVSANSGIA